MIVHGSGSSWGSAWQISTSGLQDANLRLAVTANNVSNATTDGFIPSRIDSIAIASSGVRSHISFSAYTPPRSSSDPPSQTDYSTEGISLALAKHAFAANIAVLKAQKEESESTVIMAG